MAIVSVLLKILLTIVLAGCLYVWYWVDTMRLYGDEDPEDWNDTNL